MSDGDPEKNDGDCNGDGPHGTGIDARGSPNPPPPPAGNDRAVGNDGGPPEGAVNNLQHGLYADPENILAHLEEEDPDAYAWIEAKVEGYLTDAPFDMGSPKAEQLRQIAAREYAIWQATGIQLEEGVVVETPERTAEGDVVNVEIENPVNLPLDRMERTVTRRLEELGVLDSAERGHWQES